MLKVVVGHDPDGKFCTYTSSGDGDERKEIVGVKESARHAGNQVEGKRVIQCQSQERDNKYVGPKKD